MVVAQILPIAFRKSTENLVRIVLLVGVACAVLFVAYFVAQRDPLLMPLEPIILLAFSFIFILAFSLYFPKRIEKGLNQDISVGRYFFGCAIGLSIAFLLGVIGLLWMGILNFSLFITIHQLEALIFLPYVILTFINVNLCLDLGYRYYRLTQLTKPDTEPIYARGGLFIIIGIPCLVISVVLFILAAMVWDPLSEILTLLAFILFLLFFILLIASVILDQRYSSRQDPPVE